MQVNLYATFRLAAGVSSFPIHLPDEGSAREAVRQIVEQQPALRMHWLDADGSLHAHVQMFINGQEVQTLPLGMDTPLKDEDVLDFFPPVAGG